MHCITFGNKPGSLSYIINTKSTGKSIQKVFFCTSNHNRPTQLRSYRGRLLGCGVIGFHCLSFSLSRIWCSAGFDTLEFKARIWLIWNISWWSGSGNNSTSAGSNPFYVDIANAFVLHFWLRPCEKVFGPCLWVPLNYRHSTHHSEILVIGLSQRDYIAWIITEFAFEKCDNCESSPSTKQFYLWCLWNLGWKLVGALRYPVLEIRLQKFQWWIIHAYIHCSGNQQSLTEMSEHLLGLSLRLIDRASARKTRWLPSCRGFESCLSNWYHLQVSEPNQCLFLNTVLPSLDRPMSFWS